MREKSCDLLVKFPTLYIVVKEAVLDGQEQVWYGPIVPLVTCVIGLLIQLDDKPARQQKRVHPLSFVS